MISNNIEVGNKLDITEIVKRNALGEQTVALRSQTYKSRVYDIIDENRIKVTMPFDGTSVVVLQLDCRYNLYFYAKRGLFKCVGHVVDRFKNGNQMIVELELTTGLKKVQRREFFRLEKLVDIEYRPLTEAETKMESVAQILRNEEEFAGYIRGVAVDLSGGGARFISNVKYEADSFILVKMKIDVNMKIIKFHVAARVLSSNSLPKEPDQYENRIEFVKIHEQEREKLVQFVFEEERKQRQKGKS